MSNSAPDEISIEDPLYNSSLGSMVTLDYVTPLTKDVNWRALTVLDKLHKRDRRVREKSIAEYAREASKGAAGLLHRLTKPRPVWCPRELVAHLAGAG